MRYGFRLPLLRLEHRVQLVQVITLHVLLLEPHLTNALALSGLSNAGTD